MPSEQVAALVDVWWGLEGGAADVFGVGGDVFADAVRGGPVFVVWEFNRISLRVLPRERGGGYGIC